MREIVEKVKSPFLMVVMLFGLFVLDSVPIGFLSVFVEMNVKEHHGFTMMEWIAILLILSAALAIFIYWSKQYKFCDWTFSGMRGKWRYVTLAFFACYFFAAVGSNILSSGGADNTVNQEALNTMMKNTPFSVMWLIAGIGAPIMEETIFRAGIMKGIFPNSKKLGLLFTTLLFALVHTPTDLGSWIIYGGMGFAFGFVYQKTERLEVSVFAHFVWNTLGIVSAYLLL